MIDSRIRTYIPHPYLGLYDGFACFRHDPHLATDTLLFQLGNINQKRTTKQKNRRLRFPFGIFVVTASTQRCYQSHLILCQDS